MGLAIMLITHDLAVVKNVADYVALMRAGAIVETVDSASFFAAPRHPYVRQLLAALPTFAPRGQPLTEPAAPSASTAYRNPLAPPASDTGKPASMRGALLSVCLTKTAANNPR